MSRFGLSDFAAGLLAVVLVGLGLFFAFSKVNPFADPYELSGVFDNAQNLKPGSPVRVAGVDVGQVTGIERFDEGSGAAEVHMEIEDEGLPIHEDAELQIRPRLFLEGNYVVDMKPGSPSAPTVDSGFTIPNDQTAHSVTTDEILKVLDKDTRQAFQTLLDDYSAAFLEGGAEAINEAIPHFADAYRETALAADALLGTEPGDLRQVVRGQQRTFAALARNPDRLRELVTNLNVTTAAFAREDEALQASIPALRDVLAVGLPALASVNAALPSVDAFARDALPGVRSADPTLRDAQPFIEQLAALFDDDELRELAADLRRTVPPLARLNAANIPFLEENRLLASCTDNVLVPFAETPIPDPDFPAASGEPFFQEAQRAFVGLAGESRTGDANGQWFRVNAASSGTNFVQLDGPGVDTLFASPLFQPQGVRPAKPERRPQFRPDVPCETQDPPNMAAPASGVTTPAVQARDSGDGSAVRVVRRELRELRDFIARDRAGEETLNPLEFFGEQAERRAARRRGLERTDDGVYRPREDGER